MGEIAEMMLEGLLDEETGEFIDGEAPGYPRRMSEWTHEGATRRGRYPANHKPFNSPLYATRAERARAKRQRRRARDAARTEPRS